MHAPPRLRHAVLATLCAGLLAATGCARNAPDGGLGTEGTAGAGEILLQPAAAHGPDPFTASTVRRSGAAASATPSHRAPAPEGSGPHTLPGSTPGLYGGVRSVSSCDVARQIRLLAADPARQKAFARAAGVPAAEVAGFLRGLTPVVLRADTRVTDHGFRDGAATAFPAVLQGGTAVLVDGRGLPRVRCACGNPLGRLAGADGVRGPERGEAWTGYDPARTVVVAPAARALAELLVVDSAHGRWIARPTGDEGARDRAPAEPPPYAPETDITGPLPEVSPSPSARPKPETPAPEDCPPTGTTPPGEAVVAPREPGAATDCPVPSGEPTGGRPEPFPGIPTDEPTGTPADPDAPPEDLVPLMTDEPQTSIRLPWREDGGRPPGDGRGTVHG
ncbi:DUF6777 domain-containing protein [Streptomyces sp. NPDC059783]|uniref:DUF6777 domain-containing protein n=1 Tax=Streptomyces sp. NPDC059783 TaxID=3346944 RepID=UPI0036472095